jgi:hypothetical protein
VLKLHFLDFISLDFLEIFLLYFPITVIKLFLLFNVNSSDLTGIVSLALREDERLFFELLLLDFLISKSSLESLTLYFFLAFAALSLTFCLSFSVLNDSFLHFIQLSLITSDSGIDTCCEYSFSQSSKKSFKLSITL